MKISKNGILQSKIKCDISHYLRKWFILTLHKFRKSYFCKFSESLFQHFLTSSFLTEVTTLIVGNVSCSISISFPDIRMRRIVYIWNILPWINSQCLVYRFPGENQCGPFRCLLHTTLSFKTGSSNREERSVYMINCSYQIHQNLTYRLNINLIKVSMYQGLGIIISHWP